ncbi:MAG TPA: polysaccharide deacetylase family protein [Sphingobium sp.]|uniref:polysaccharide deacetylase family protein n=1 Tax=Sphingobium sp. TaxID=1912891 RepID=UPI002ED16EDF
MITATTVVALSFFLAGSADARSGKIALTFDDLPALTILKDQSYVTWLNQRLLQGLKRHHLPATGFVNEGKLNDLDHTRQIDVLNMWLDAGMNLGNHSFSHKSPNILGANAYIRDIKKGEPVTKALLARHHRTLRWFRHPYLETGSPEPVKRQINGWLATHGYRIAPVTIDANDWEFAEPYDDAIARRDETQRRLIKAEYLQYTEKMLGWYRQAAHTLFNRDIAYIMLLHATRLNADSIDDLAAILRRNGLHGVPLDKAMKDPAYRTPDHYAGPDGIEWLERWSQTLHKDLPWASFSDPPANIQSAYRRVDNDY